MQIHVVEPNQTLSSIASLYGIAPAIITEANDLQNPDRLVVGQAIVIPIIGRFYWVQPGDSLYTIARRFGISYQELARINGISVNQPIRVGLRLYIPQGPKREGEFLAYVEPRRTGTVSPVLESSAREASPYLTYLAPFAYLPKRDGTLDPPS